MMQTLVWQLAVVVVVVVVVVETLWGQMYHLGPLQ
jgi:hypothetical protein